MIDETAIIGKCRQGDLKAFSEIYNHYVKRIYDFIYYQTYHRETAEDITSSTFMKALEGIRDFNEKKGKLSSWLYRIAKNAVIDYYRKKKNTVNIDDIWDLAGGEDVEIDVINRDTFERIQESMSKLTPDKRAVIIMRIWQDIPYREIAEITGKSEAQCKMTFYRAIEKIKRQIPAAFTAIFYFSSIN